MELFVNIKQIGSKKQPAAVPFSVEGSPRTAGELIEETVKVCVREYNERVRRGDSSPQPLTKQQIKDMADVGKIAFGINYGGREQDVSKAIENALQAFEDGIFKLFVNGRELRRRGHRPEGRRRPHLHQTDITGREPFLLKGG